MFMPSESLSSPWLSDSATTLRAVVRLGEEGGRLLAGVMVLVLVVVVVLLVVSDTTTVVTVVVLSGEREPSPGFVASAMTTGCPLPESLPLSSLQITSALATLAPPDEPAEAAEEVLPMAAGTFQVTGGETTVSCAPATIAKPSSSGSGCSRAMIGCGLARPEPSEPLWEPEELDRDISRGGLRPDHES